MKFSRHQREVNATLDLVKRETERIESRFLEPVCGGLENFSGLVPIRAERSPKN
jgi:hypothetical protein